MPLCALVATRDLSTMEPLVMSIDHGRDNDDDADADADENEDFNALQDLTLQVLKRYIAEITELRSYTTMAHPFPTYKPPLTKELTQPCPPRFHSIDANYPGLECIHRDPNLWLVDNFLTSEECQSIIHAVSRHDDDDRLRPCLIKNADTGRVQADPTRTSTTANLPQAAVPTVTDKICQLLQCPSRRHLEIFQVLRYTAGQSFLPHTDGFDGPVASACGFEHSGRLVTLFCYLNTLEPGSGGETRFPQLSASSKNGVDKGNSEHNTPLAILPVQGRAVLHFPNSLELGQDLRTEHESLPVIRGEKWLLVTWCWKHARSNPAYHEALVD